MDLFDRLSARFRRLIGGTATPGLADAKARDSTAYPGAARDHLKANLPSPRKKYRPRAARQAAAMPYVPPAKRALDKQAGGGSGSIKKQSSGRLREERSRSFVMEQKKSHKARVQQQQQPQQPQARLRLDVVPRRKLTLQPTVLDLDAARAGTSEEASEEGSGEAPTVVCAARLSQDAFERALRVARARAEEAEELAQEALKLDATRSRVAEIRRARVMAQYEAQIAREVQQAEEQSKAERERVLREVAERLRAESDRLRAEVEMREREEIQRLQDQARMRRAAFEWEQLVRDRQGPEPTAGPVTEDVAVWSALAEYEYKWRMLQEHGDQIPARGVPAHEFPWPVFGNGPAADTLTFGRMDCFVFHRWRAETHGMPPRDVIVRELGRYHPDKFEVYAGKIVEQDEAFARTMGGIVAEILMRMLARLDDAS